MPSPIAHIGDMISHGGLILEASPNVIAQGRGVARVGDRAYCSKHKLVQIISGSKTVLTNGKQTAHNGSLCSCGATVISSGNVLV